MSAPDAYAERLRDISYVGLRPGDCADLRAAAAELDRLTAIADAARAVVSDIRANSGSIGSDVLDALIAAVEGK